MSVWGFDNEGEKELYILAHKITIIFIFSVESKEDQEEKR